MKVHQIYGTWKSPFTAEVLSHAIGLSEPCWDKKKNILVWREQDDGRGFLVGTDFSGDCPKKITFEQDVRARVGYGGGHFSVSNGVVVFVGNKGKIYRQDLEAGPAVPITPGFGQCASPQISPDGKHVVYVYEFEGESGLAIVPLDGQRWPQKVVVGDDFYMDPRWSDDGNWLSWICWNHPNMPWDGSFLQMVSVSEKKFCQDLSSGVRTIAGGKYVSVVQPEFSPVSDHLAYVSDESGWYNLYLYNIKTEEKSALVQEEAEYGNPAWILGMRSYDWMGDGKKLVAIKNVQGFSSLETIDATTGKVSTLSLIEERYAYFESINVSSQGRIVLLASRYDMPMQLVIMSQDRGKSNLQVLQRSANEQIPSIYYAKPESLHPKNEQGQVIYGLLYSPQSPDFQSKGKPPLIVQVHGGPTSQALPVWKGDVQFFTSRGYAYLDLNYRGSSGYGRRYRDLLLEKWGVYDVEDAVFMASYLIKEKRVDPEKIVIKGSSAGGYTVLQALVNHPVFFRAGICSYGISNLFSLVQDTHKFEQHYTDSLIGILPEAASVFHERSPLFFADRIERPLILFQGEEDKVVPMNQSDAISATLAKRQVPHEYHVFSGEGHGWRKQETIAKYYKAISNFLGKYVVFLT
ncbi:MAG: S9 family peptidase [SAR324 cluster bacterium]|nr:S9 family peptidase [SAR324 cluster bacterium]